ncbi:hypothetical protein [uncultured Sporomusa sp.]|nr:hypothetical protein [uncultured Sporomusa sp.]
MNMAISSFFQYVNRGTGQQALAVACCTTGTLFGGLTIYPNRFL